jgi:hypothetical protein
MVHVETLGSKGLSFIAILALNALIFVGYVICIIAGSLSPRGQDAG